MSSVHVLKGVDLARSEGKRGRKTVKPGEFRASGIRRSLLEDPADALLRVPKRETVKPKEAKGASFELEGRSLISVCGFSVWGFRVRDLVRRGTAHGKIRGIVWL